MARVPRFLDVSVSLAEGTPTHTGTHVDAPRHFFDDGTGTDALALDMLIGRARVVDLPRRGGISADDLAAAGLNLSDVEPGMYELYCLPLRVAGSDGAPARVVLKR